MAGCDLFEQRLNHRRTPKFLTDENEGNEDTGILPFVLFASFVSSFFQFVSIRLDS